MSRRTRWWLRSLAPAFPFAVFGVVALVWHGPPGSGVLALGAAATLVAQTIGSVWLYQAGYGRGRVSGLLDAVIASRGGRIPDPIDPRPWDEPRAWPR